MLTVQNMAEQKGRIEGFSLLGKNKRPDRVTEESRGKGWGEKNEFEFETQCEEILSHFYV